MAGRISFEHELDLRHVDLMGALAVEEPYVDELIGMAAESEDFAVVLTDNLGKDAMLRFKEAYGDRLIDAGIAEPNAVAMSAGIAISGKKVYTQNFGPFLILRCLDQIHTDVAYNNAPVRLMETHAGLTSGGGPTHYQVMDIAVGRVMPNMLVEMPCDANQCVKAIRASKTYEGPMLMRMARGVEPPVYTTQEYAYELGKAVTAKEGGDITIIACGIGVALAISAANGMEKEGVSVRVIDMHTVRPIDRGAVLKAARETGRIITVEDHYVVGGLGSAVAEILADEAVAIPFKRLGVPNEAFPSLGDSFELYAHFGFDPEGIKKQIRLMVEK